MGGRHRAAPHPRPPRPRPSPGSLLCLALLLAALPGSAPAAAEAPPPDPEPWLVVYKAGAVAAARRAAEAAADGDAQHATAGAFVRPAKAAVALRALGVAPTRSLVLSAGAAGRGGPLAIDVVPGADAARALRAASRDVAWVEPDQRVRRAASLEGNSTLGPVYLHATANVSEYWGLDRIDQRLLPLDGKFTYYTSPEGSGAGVDVYVLDSGLRASHREFRGRAANVATYHPLGGGLGPDIDRHGGGTHLAAIIAGADAGVARNATLYGVKVLEHTGVGQASDLIAGIDFVMQRANASGRPTIISHGGWGNFSRAVNEAVRRATQAGILVVVGAGWNARRSAARSSPASAAAAVTVAASNASDGCAPWSSSGSAVDIFGPGADILSASNHSDTVYAYFSDTGSASGFAAGVAASLWSACPGCRSADIASQLLRRHATPRAVKRAPAGTTRRMIYSRFQ